MTHVRRQGNHKSSSINFTSNTVSNGNQEDFLCNTVNKEKLISSLSLELQNQGGKAIVCDGDAEVMIVQTAIYLGAKSNVTVIGEDTDLLVLLLYHAQKSEFNLYIRSDKEKKKASNKVSRTFNISACQELIGRDICSNIIFLHAFTGCDSTSKFFKITKSAVFEKLISNQDFLCRFSKYAESFSKDGQPPDIIETAGISTMILLYDGNDK